MFYAILGLLVIVALFLIFRDDHDTSYNKSERAPQKSPFQQPVQRPMPPKKPVAPVAPVAPAPVAPSPVSDLSFLDDIEYFDELVEDTDTFDVAGLRYHCTLRDIGPIRGMVKPEPSNLHDSRAQAVYRQDGKLLGYISRTQLDFYGSFNETNVPCPFVGEIELDRSTARLIAEIKVIIPTSREFVESEINSL